MSLFKACEEGSVKEVREAMAAGADPNMKAPRGKRPLEIACKGQYLDVVLCLLDHGANINFNAGSGINFFHTACRDGSCVPIIQCLVQHRASLNEVGYQGCKPLHAA